MKNKQTQTEFLNNPFNVTWTNYSFVTFFKRATFTVRCAWEFCRFTMTITTFTTCTTASKYLDQFRWSNAANACNWATSVSAYLPYVVPFTSGGFILSAAFQNMVCRWALFLYSFKDLSVRGKDLKLWKECFWDVFLGSLKCFSYIHT